MRPFMKALADVDLGALADADVDAAWQDDGTLLDALLGERPHGAARRRGGGAAAGAGVDGCSTCRQRGQRADAAVRPAGEFDFADDFGWLDITHGMTYANAARWHHRQAAERGSGPTPTWSGWRCSPRSWPTGPVATSGTPRRRAGRGRPSARRPRAYGDQLQRESLLDGTTAFIVHAHAVKTSRAAAIEALGMNSSLPLDASAGSWRPRSWNGSSPRRSSGRSSSSTAGPSATERRRRGCHPPPASSGPVAASGWRASGSCSRTLPGHRRRGSRRGFAWRPRRRWPPARSVTACRTARSGAPGRPIRDVASQVAPAAVPGLLPWGRGVGALRAAQFGERLPAAVGQRELALVVDLLGGEQPVLFHPGERRVDRPGARPPAATAARLEFGDQLVAVHRALVEQRQDGVADGAPPSALPVGAAAAVVVVVSAHVSPFLVGGV